MCPRMSIDDIANGPLADIEFSGNRLDGHAFVSHFAYARYVCFSQLGKVVGGTLLAHCWAMRMKGWVGTTVTPSVASILGNTVSHVICICSQPQMVGIDAGGVVTGMTDMKATWDGANEQEVGRTVSANHLAAHLESPVPLMGLIGRPVPASIISRFMLLVESCHNRFHKESLMAKGKVYTVVEVV